MNKFLAVLVIVSCSALAESPLEKELNTLNSQRQAQIDAATVPINQRYNLALTSLYHKALAAKDMELVNKILQLSANLNTPKVQSDKYVGDWFVDATRHSWLVIMPGGKVNYGGKPLVWKIEDDGKLSITNQLTGQVALWRISGDTYTGTDWDGKPMKGTKKK